jgi:tRNA dimethylallyltransferase
MRQITDTISGRLIVVCGPTATGKTDLAIQLAGELGGEIVGADSRQVYRYMDIGTAKPTPEQRARAPHHLIDVANPDEPFSLADYLAHARAAVADITTRGRVPIVAGGTGLYARALTRGFAVPRVAPDPALRLELERLAVIEGVAALWERLRTADPDAALVVDRNNPRRLIRAIEVAESRPPGAPALLEDVPTEPAQDTPPRYDALLLGLTAERAILHARADRRVDAMMAAGFLDEVSALYARGYAPSLPALSSLGYREFGESLRGERPLDDAAQATKWATHRFIRRQLTWFRGEPGIQWFDVTRANIAGDVSRLAAHWLMASEPATHVVRSA